MLPDEPHGEVAASGGEVALGSNGAVTAVQSVSSDLRRNPHFHSILLDGVFVTNERGEPQFHPLRELDTSDVADLMQVIGVRILGYLVRMGVIDNACDLNVLEDRLVEREPALAQLAASAISGLVPAGRELRQREPVALRSPIGVEIMGPLSVAETC